MTRARGLAIAGALVALTAAALALRHTGSRIFLFHPDERVFCTQVRLLREQDPKPELTQNFRYYPLFVARVARLCEPARRSEPATVAEHVAASQDDVSRLRTIVAILAALAVPAVYALARCFLGRGASLLAAALCAASPLAIAYGQQARPHAASVGPLVAAALACVLVRRRPVFASYAVAGIAIGFALSILHTGIAIVPALIVAHVLRDRARAKHAVLGLCAALLVAAVIAVSVYPGGWRSIQLWSDTGTEATTRLSGHKVPLERFTGGGFATLFRSALDYEPWLLSLATLGAAIWLVRRIRARDLVRVRGREDFAVIAAWCVPYALLIGLYADSYERFLLPLLPAAACAAAYAVVSASRALSTRTPHKVPVAIAVGAIALAPQAYFAVRLARVYAAGDTPTACARWVRDNIPPGSARVAVLFTIDLPLLRELAAVRENPRELFEVERRYWVKYQSLLPPDVLAEERYDMVTVPLRDAGGLEQFESDLEASVASWNADYVVIPLRPRTRFRVDDVRPILQTRATRVARFGPYEDEIDDVPFGGDNDPAIDGWWTGHLLRAVRFGPVIEVYRMR